MESGEIGWKSLKNDGNQVCQICEDNVGSTEKGKVFIACDVCAFPVCSPCYEYKPKDGNQSYPQCKTRYKRQKGSPAFVGEEEDVNEDDITMRCLAHINTLDLLTLMHVSGSDSDSDSNGTNSEDPPPTSAMYRHMDIEQRKADENLIRLDAEQMREKWKVLKNVLDMERQLDAKQVLELEIEELKGNCKS
ncbi:hypothetical protein M8C21_012507 [Ambrosia artemisiifolia]|uniref:Cellulose synthase RING-type zinc finger domain-containing protein n=1 Tax=Ambrosia artemisiifolia TaxID=4212 RepID=A0AAD5C046_AMBAR|nr:hypothetical protein M8C21_012507 [Ambrosia artemisiifolia]